MTLAVKQKLMVGGGGLVLALLALVGGFDVAPPRYEPLGAGAVPIGAGVGVLIGSILLLVGVAVERAKGGAVAETPAPAPPLFPQRLKVALTLATMAVYIALFDSPLGFRGATVAYVIAAGLVMGVHGRRQIALIVALALAIAFGCYYLFTRIFVIDIA